jgi:hypothetical protein
VLNAITAVGQHEDKNVVVIQAFESLFAGAY